MKWQNLKTWKLKKEWEDEAYSSKYNVYPPKQFVYRAFNTTFEEVKVVILGQDPYHTKGMANGLAFSTFPHITNIPPSLSNILGEYSSDLGYPRPRTGDLDTWANNGVLLLNRVLTVEEGRPNSHEGIGWEKLTYETVRSLSDKREGIVWMLWGRKAQEFQAGIDPDKHLILTAGHPSPLNSKRDFLGCKHFSKACDYLGVDKDIWRLP